MVLIQILCNGVSKKSKDKRKVRQKVCESTYKAIRYGEFYFIKDKKCQNLFVNFAVFSQLLLVMLRVIALKAHISTTNGLASSF